MTPVFSSRRIVGALGCAAYLFAVVVAPAVHIWAEHVGVDPKAIDPNAFKDAHGQIDLAKLAEALGLGESRPHSHGPGEPQHDAPLNHGQGAVQHFGLALLTATSVAIIPITSAPLPLSPQAGSTSAPTLERWDFDSGWPQAPPRC